MIKYCCDICEKVIENGSYLEIKGYSFTNSSDDYDGDDIPALFCSEECAIKWIKEVFKDSGHP